MKKDNIKIAASGFSLHKLINHNIYIESPEEQKSFGFFFYLKF